MRPWIVLSAAAVGLGFAGLLAWPRYEVPALQRDAALSENGPPRSSAASEAAPQPGVSSPETVPSEGPEPPRDDLAPPPVPREVHTPPEPEARAEADSELAPLVDAAGNPSRTLVRAALAEAVARDHPDLEPSPEALDRAADAILRIRAAQKALAALPLTLENAGQRVALRENLQAASEAFREAMGLSSGDFTAGVETPGGVDRFDPGEAIPEPSYLDEPAPEGAG